MGMDLGILEIRYDNEGEVFPSHEMLIDSAQRPWGFVQWYEKQTDVLQLISDAWYDIDKELITRYVKEVEDNSPDIQDIYDTYFFDYKDNEKNLYELEKFWSLDLFKRLLQNENFLNGHEFVFYYNV